MDKMIEQIVYMIFEEEVELNDPTQTIEQIIQKLKNKTVRESEENTYEDCEYCCGDVDMRDYLISDGSEGVYIDGNGKLSASDDNLDFNDKKLNFCPICGRKL